MPVRSFNESVINTVKEERTIRFTYYVYQVNILGYFMILGRSVFVMCLQPKINTDLSLVRLNGNDHPPA